MSFLSGYVRLEGDRERGAGVGQAAPRHPMTCSGLGLLTCRYGLLWGEGH